jgi:hypothetical protein
MCYTKSSRNLRTRSAGARALRGVDRPPMQTKTLFSSHYLDKRLPEHAEWAEDARPALETLDLEDFWRLDQGQWVWLLRQNLRRVEAMSNLVGVYRAYRTRLAPLMERIQRTDWLIDQIVYRLYGLTGAEVAVVEGRGA